MDNFKKHMVNRQAITSGKWSQNWFDSIRFIYYKKNKIT